MTSTVYTSAQLAAMNSMTGAMKELADGNFQVALPGLEDHDEVGEMGRAVARSK